MSPERKQRIKQIAEPIRQIGQVLGVAACVYFSGNGMATSDKSIEALARIEQKLDAHEKRASRMEKFDDRHEDRDNEVHSSQWRAITELRNKVNDLNIKIHSNPNQP